MTQKPTSTADLIRGRAWSRFAFVFGAGLSIAANVLHCWYPATPVLEAWQRTAPTGAAYTPPIGQIAWAAAMPLVLLASVEILTRVAWRAGRLWKTARYGGVGVVGLGAGVISYLHGHDLMRAWGEPTINSVLGPLLLDGLMVVAGFALLNISLQLADHAARPAAPAPAPVAARPLPATRPVVSSAATETRSAAWPVTQPVVTETRSAARPAATETRPAPRPVVSSAATETRPAPAPVATEPRPGRATEPTETTRPVATEPVLAARPAATERRPAPRPTSGSAAPAAEVDVTDLLPAAREIAAEHGDRLTRDGLMAELRDRHLSVGGKRRDAIWAAVRPGTARPALRVVAAETAEAV